MASKFKNILVQRNTRSHPENNKKIQQLVNDPNRKGKIYSKSSKKRKKLKVSPERPADKVFVLDPFIYPKAQELPTPDWFRTSEKVDVSIIVPLFRSKACITEQIKKWSQPEPDISTEIIYVDDCCPDKTYTQITSIWAANRPTFKIGKIVKHSKNAGFGPTCNTGAAHASGDYLIFLNADTVVTPNWISPLVKRLKSDPKIGLVGNLQLNPKGYIDSAGSRWSWRSKSFLHIGRNIYQDRELKEPIRYNKAPRDLLRAAPRDMVTGACFIIRKELFNRIGGFDLDYRIGYWEDSDLCMKVKDAGLEIWYEPQSMIYHKVGQSKGGGHKYRSNNKKIFMERWVNNYKVDKHCSARPGLLHIPNGLKDAKKGKTVGCVIALNEEEFLEASVDSVAPLIDEWIFVIGGNEYAQKAGMCNPDGTPIDKTLEIAHELANTHNGTVIGPPGRLWKDKVEMRNAYATKLKPGDWMFMLDGDEVYTEDQLWRVTQLMTQYEVLIMQFWLFWNNVNTIGTGKWDNYPQERVVKWREGYGYRGKNHLHVSAHDSVLVNKKVKTWRGNERLFYHYSWVRPLEKIYHKMEYYRQQSGVDNRGYVDDVFLRWRKNPNAVNGKTHPMGGGNWTEFGGQHPPQVQKLIDEGKLNF